MSDPWAVFLINSYGTPLVQRASYLALYSSFFCASGKVNYDYIVTNIINYLLIDLVHASKRIKHSALIWAIRPGGGGIITVTMFAQKGML